MVDDRIADLRDRFGRKAFSAGFLPETIGLASGDPIQLWTRQAARPNAPVVFLSTGIHGDEPCGPEALVSLFAKRSMPDLFNWVVAPLLNPAGLRCGCRENREGIDLNRDFLRQRSVEVNSLTRWWQRRPIPCHLHLSLHEDWEAEGFYVYEIDTSTRDSMAAEILRTVTLTAPLQQTGPIDGHDLDAPGFIAHRPEPDDHEGWPEAIWMARSWPLQSYTFEAPGRAPFEVRVAALVTATEAAIEAVARDRRAARTPSTSTSDCARHPARSGLTI